jgi:hypothetical protein
MATRIAVAALLLMLSGCMVGPQWSDEVHLGIPAGSIQGRKVVVSNFVKSVSATSTTNSQQIVEIKESVQVSDISGAIADALRARGIAAEARKDVKAAYLRDDEVLLSGAVLTQERYTDWGMWLPASLFSGLSLTLLPTPVPFRQGNALVYRVELDDGRGRILYQSGDRPIVGTFDTYHFYGVGLAQETAPRKLSDDLVSKLSVALQDVLATAGAGSAASFTSDRPASDSASLPPDLDQAYRLLQQSQSQSDSAHYDDAVRSAEKALGLAESGIAGRDELALEAFVSNCGMQYVARARAAHPTDLADLEKARPYFERAYEIRLRELGRDDERTRQLETFILSVWGTDSLGRAESRSRSR